VDRGFIFVATNYRFVPDVTVEEQAGDIAKAIRWIHDHAQDYGGSPDSIFIAGHSAGAHLAALVCTDERYLKHAGLSLANIKGCIPVDTAAYDVPRRIQLSLLRGKRFYTNVFTEDEGKQKAVSPIAHVSKGKSIPPFLILHVADRPGAKVQSEAFAKALRASGVDATVFAAEDKTHMTINSELGQPDDPPTKALIGFLAQVLQARYQ
jgi:acetyl esterase/lipase